jgi:predicted PilT family ATPase
MSEVAAKGASKGGAAKVEKFRQSIPIPKNSVGLIIGREGRSIQNIQTRSGCKIQINDKAHTQFGEEWAYAIIESDAVHKMNIAKQLLVLNIMKYVEIKQLRGEMLDGGTSAESDDSGEEVAETSE